MRNLSATLSDSHLTPNTAGRILFLALLIIEASFFATLVWSHRIPAGHDALQDFTLKYYFLNSVVTSGEIPQWMPFMTHGTVANWWYFVQGGILQNFFLLAGKLIPQHANFLPYYYLTIFFDQLLLLVGVWLLSGEWYKSILSRFLVTSAAIGSCIWFQQPWFNFHLYFALPLIIYLYHRWFDTANAKYLASLGIVIAVQWVGGLPYFIPLTLLTLAIYLLSHLAFNWPSAKDFGNKLIESSWAHLGAFIFCGALLLVPYLILSHGTEWITNYNPGRLADGSTTYDVFIQYGGSTNLQRWSEWVYRFPFDADYTLHFGYSAFILSIVGLLGLTRKSVPIAITASCLFLFSSGIPEWYVHVLYEYFPGMRYYRHIALAAPLVKLFLILMAGFGLDRLLQKSSKQPLKNQSILWLGILLMGMAVWLFTLEHINPLSEMVLNTLSPPGMAFYDMVTQQPLIEFRKESAIWMLIIGAIFALAGKQPLPKRIITLAILILIIHPAELYSYKSQIAGNTTRALSASQYQAQSFEPIPYAPYREVTMSSTDGGSRLATLLPLFEDKIGASYWSNESYLFRDTASSLYRLDHFLSPLDNLLKAFWRQPIHSPNLIPRGLKVFPNLSDIESEKKLASVQQQHYRRLLVFPLEFDDLRSIAGISKPKLQFFQNSRVVSDEKLIALEIIKPGMGNQLFLSTLPGQAHNVQTLTSQENVPDKTKWIYEVRSYSSNSISVEVNTPAKKNGGWLYYSDVWHPYWEASVNGNRTPVLRANLAYKAVALAPGRNMVQFEFNNPVLLICYWIIGVMSALICGWLCWCVASLGSPFAWRFRGRFPTKQ